MAGAAQGGGGAVGLGGSDRAEDLDAHRSILAGEGGAGWFESPPPPLPVPSLWLRPRPPFGSSGLVLKRRTG
ncbi:hypothetical protein GCM10018771_66390 [Streptomyces cellulosae]|nr:hypothetical protein GCM10018771_66390 [Streptomyces cellulosae]